MIEQLWLVPLGFVAGIAGSIIGLGGGFIVVPVLIFLGFPPTLATSNSLFGVLSNAVSSTISYHRQGRVDISLGIKLGLLSVPGTVVGAVVSSDVTSDAFKILFGVVLVASVAYIFLRGKIGIKGQNNSRGMIAFVAAASFFAGIVSSLFGVGGGIIFVPLMIAGMGMAMKRAAPTSQMILLFASFSGVVVHSLLGHPDFLQAGMLAVGSFFGGLVGARIMPTIREQLLQIAASSVILIVAAKMFLDSAYGGLFLGEL